ncbi:hypothetical protein [Paraliomyxa miuraensis]|uniref:hypothetical protein n=1 Tax=Paraliomyxa miuraensis TaxID=376150 RepID=UPI0022572038|nr:hypothetical protein [Paraliomyxa miuraensis]MCX4240954.1 hypothetical protein [Paraliomyxa miuraensis]
MLLASLVGACVVPKSVGSGEDGASGDGSGTTDKTTDGATDTDPADTDPTDGATSQVPTTGATLTGFETTTEGETGMAWQCPPTPEFQCTQPVTCSEGCGGPFSPFDEQGCLRPSCANDDGCADGETCLHPIDYGGCASSGMFCSDGPGGECQCGGDPDCGGGFCVPDDEVPALDCFGLPDEPSCIDANCSEFHTVLQITDTCECMPGVPACLLFLGDIGGPDAPNYFWHEATNTVAMFGTDWFEPPVGWQPCSAPGAPPACGCYEPYTEPRCP